MNNLGKIIIFFTLLILVIPYGISQETNPKKGKTAIKSFFSVEANLGMSGKRRNVSMYTLGFDKKEVGLLENAFVSGANFVGGIQINHYFKVGLGTGYFYYKQKEGNLYDSSIRRHILFDKTGNTYIAYPRPIITHGIPLFVYFRSDFLDRKITPYMDFKIGNNFLFSKEVFDIVDINKNPSMYVWDERFLLKFGLFLASNIGVSFRMSDKLAINTSIGYQYVSTPFDMFKTSSWRKNYWETKYSIIDHQFMFNVGISF